MNLEITAVESTVTGGTRYGGEEVISQAILGWLFDGGKGELRIAAHDSDNEEQRRAVLTFRRVRGLKKDCKNKQTLKGETRVGIQRC